MGLPRNNLLFGFGPKLDEYQKIYVDSIFNNQLTIVNAPAGTGKTTLAVACAKIIGMDLLYVFAPVEENKMGFRPGTQMEKEGNYLGPLQSALLEIGENPMNCLYNEDRATDPKMGKETMRLVKEGSIWVYAKSHIFARGTNIKNKFLIIDEAQNFTKCELKKLLTRVHDDVRIVMSGHLGQCDINPSASGFAEYIEFFRNKDYCQICELKKNFRGKLATDADQC